MRKQTFTFHFDASPHVVYKAMLDPELLPKWRVPDDMKMKVHQFDPREEGKFRISLTYDDSETSGKSEGNTDTYHGYFKTLVPDQKIVEVIEFEGKEADMGGEMIITTELFPFEGGAQMVATHENLPMAVPSDQNELGWRMSLQKLAELLRTGLIK